MRVKAVERFKDCGLIFDEIARSLRRSEIIQQEPHISLDY
jgi:hypothetical protein